MSIEQIDLFRGWPHPSLLPAAQFKAAAEAALSNSEVYIPGLLYGPDDGFQPLKTNLARWLSEFYSGSRTIPPERICITGGASQNISCCLQAFSDPVYTRVVWMVSPTYYLACRIFEDGGFAGRLRSVPEDQEGLDIEYLAKAMQQTQDALDDETVEECTLRPSRAERKFYRHIIYAVPSFANPSSRCMSAHRREQLVRLARLYDALIISDDVYDQLQWSIDKPAGLSGMRIAGLPRLVDIDRVLDGGAERDDADGFGNTMSNGSFSKIAAPGCRTGWAEGTPKLAWGLSQVGSSKSGGAPSHMTATFMSRLLESGELQSHIFDTLQPAYARRHQTMMSAIDQHLRPLGVSLPQNDRKISGGYFIWIMLPEPLLAEDVVRAAKNDQNLIIVPGTMFAVWGDEKAINLDRNIRLTFAWEAEKHLSEGIKRLACVIQEILGQ